MIHNNILTLPNQKNLMNGKPFGHFYFVDFKYYDRYRSYSFDKTDKLAVKYPNIREFKDYGEILRLSEKLTEDFEKFTSVKE